MAQALASTGAEVIPLAPLLGPVFHRWTAAVLALLSSIAGRRYLRDRHPPLLRSIGTEARRAIDHVKPDIVFSPGTLPLAFLECDVPLTFWTDATFARLVNYYPEFSRVWGSSARDADSLEQRALDRTSAAVYSSEWAARSAVADYGITRERVCVAPFGPNVPPPADGAAAERIIADRSTAACRLLFISTGWKRKGGPRALEIARGVAAAGIPVELTLVGRIPRGIALPEYVRATGWLDKRIPSATARLCELLRESHFLLFPSEADCSPITLIEAAAYGVPALAPDIGGISEIVRNDVTGALLPADAESDDYVRFIADTWERHDRYAEMAASAHAEYRRRLNWPNAGLIVRRRLDALAGSP